MAETEQTDDRGDRPSPGQRGPVHDRLSRRLPIYAAYVMSYVGGGFAVSFATDSKEWFAGPVALAYLLLFGWYWLYSVGYRYGRPLLKYFSLTAGMAFGAILAAVCLDRAPAQFAAGPEGAFNRGAVPSLYWAGFITAASALVIFIHALVLGSGRTIHNDSL